MSINLGDKMQMLKKGTKVKCDLCREGYYKPLSEDINKCYYFKCDKCGEMIIETKKLKL